MRIFLTGATGFIGSHVTPLLLAGGHKVLGLTRSDAGAEALRKAGAAPHRGSLEDVDSLADGAVQADAVIHCAFDHDFSNFVANCEKDRRAIAAMGAALKGTNKKILITSGTGIGAPGHGEMAVEDVFNLDHPNPRIASEVEGAKLADAGVQVMVMRLPQVHDTEKQGLVSPYIDISRAKGMAGYVGDGANGWPAAHVSDVAQLYKLAIEQGRAGERFHAVAEEGIAARAIATVVGQGLGVPVKSMSSEEAAEHFGWMAMFMSLDMPASSAWTRRRLGWTPKGPGIIADLEKMDYGARVHA